MRSRALTAFAACIVVTAIIASAAAPARAEEHRQLLATCVLMGINRSEAMSLNFINVGDEVLVATLLFQDWDGRPVKTSRAQVGPGESLSLELSYGEVAAPAGVRTPVFVVVLAEPLDPASDSPSESGVASLEVFDEMTGKSAYGLLMPVMRISAASGADAGMAPEASGPMKESMETMKKAWKDASPTPEGPRAD